MAIIRRGNSYTLTGNTADAFIEQFVKNPKPNPLAQAAYNRGLKTYAEYQKKGYAKLEVRKKNNAISKDKQK
jgi:hypothetical protein